MEIYGVSPRLINIRLHPIKSLDPISVTEARIGPAGGLEFDRAWALYTADNRWINGKRTPAMLRIRAAFAPDLSHVTLSAPEDDRDLSPVQVPFPEVTDTAAQWFSAYFQQPVFVRQSQNGFPDDPIANGPTIISTSTLETVCRWFPSISLNEARRRFRTTLEIGSDAGAGEELPAFWEDRLFGPTNTYPIRFRIGEVNFEGSNPCARCSVPSRDSRSGSITPDFQRHFTDMRREHLPAWAIPEHFDHYYRLAVNTRTALSEAGKTLRVGDSLILL